MFSFYFIWVSSLVKISTRYIWISSSINIMYSFYFMGKSTRQSLLAIVTLSMTFFYFRVYFDAELGTCQSFGYGGCGGNKNNFG